MIPAFFQRIMMGLCLQWRGFLILISVLIASASQSVDATKIAYLTMRGETFTYDLKVMNADGKKTIKLTEGQASDFSPSWSPDGRRITFASNRDRDFEIYVMNADGDNIIQLTKNQGDDDFPCWSPNGSQIAFTTDRDGNYEIYVMNADGSEPVNLTQSWFEHDIFPAWQPIPLSVSTEEKLVAFWGTIKQLK